MSKGRLIGIILGALSLTLVPPVMAQTKYPSRPITLIVPFAPAAAAT